MAAKTAPGSSPVFPRFTWVTCECGCGWEGEDEVAQWLIEEAVVRRLQVDEQRDPAEEALLDRHAQMIALRDSMRGGR